MPQTALWPREKVQAFSERHRRVSKTVTDNPDLVRQCKALGVPEETLRLLLESLWATTQHLPRKIAVLADVELTARERATQLEAIDREFIDLNREGKTTARLFGFEDQVGIPDDWLPWPKRFANFYRAFPANADDTRARIGLPEKLWTEAPPKTDKEASKEARRLKRYEPLSRRTAIIHFDAMLRDYFCDHQPHSALVIDLVNALLKTKYNAEDLDLMRYRARKRRRIQ
jgi:hypothetical protein